MIGFLDLETGGFSISKNGICEVAIVATDSNLNIIDKICVLIKPYTRADDTDELVSYKDDSMAINGLSVEKLIAEGLEVNIAVKQLYDFIIKHGIIKIIGHNSKAFDIHRFKYLLLRFLGVDIMPLITEDDTLLIAKGKLNLPSYKLEDLCTHFKITNEKAHSALGDALATRELYKILIA